MVKRKKILFFAIFLLMGKIWAQNLPVEEFFCENRDNLSTGQISTLKSLNLEIDHSQTTILRSQYEKDPIVAWLISFPAGLLGLHRLYLGTSPQAASEVVRAVRKVYKKTLIVKLSPNVTNISEIAVAVEEAGADSVSLINTLLGMAIDAEKRKPILSTITGGLSGPAVKPIALRMVWQVKKAVKIPVIGLGGIMNASDAIEFMLAGASAVQVGTANFIDPAISVKIVKGMEEWCVRHGVKDISTIVGELS
jgi:dihydroorotate dehydrogenase (NAD+) catalytic subunit